ncbi:LuxR C-terminal-related transcriptional regulator, partial [Rhodococcus chondri]
ELVESAHASGLLTAGRDALIPGAAGVPATALGPHATRALAQELFGGRVGTGLLNLPLALRLVDAGVGDPRLESYLIEQAGSEEPSRAVVVLYAAVRAGAGADALMPARAEAAAAAGDLATAERLTDRLLEQAATLTGEELRAAVRVAASVAAQRGMLGRSADLYEWLGPDRAGADVPTGAAVLLAAGRPDAAAKMRAGATAGAPTSATAAAQLLEAGLRESVGGDGRIAMNSLSRALAVRDGSGRAPVQPVSVESVTALLCLHAGELAHARTVLARSGPDTRHALLSAWSTLLGGDLTTAAASAEQLSAGVQHQRDLLFLHGLRVGLARRHGDRASLAVAWDAARSVVAEYSVDLLSLLPLGELWLAAVRLGEPERIAHPVAQARDLLTVLGEPPLWGATLHWYGVQAAIAANRPADLVPHARALAVAGQSTAYAAALARAGNAWLRVLQNEVDPDRIREAAEDLARIGLPWDGARLAGEAALRVPDTREATTLLQIARLVRQPSTGAATMSADTARGVGDGHAQPGKKPGISGSPLSEREAEVADLVVSGLTYREVGNRLYISAKTVEHHVARIRRRLGAGSRSELIGMLRAIGHGDGSERARTDQNGGRPACP